MRCCCLTTLAPLLFMITTQSNPAVRLLQRPTPPVPVIPPCRPASDQCLLLFPFLRFRLVLLRCCCAQPPPLARLHPRRSAVVALLQLLQVGKGVRCQLLVLHPHHRVALTLLLQLACCCSLTRHPAGVQQLLAAFDLDLVGCRPRLGQEEAKTQQRHSTTETLFVVFVPFKVGTKGVAESSIQQCRSTTQKCVRGHRTS